MKAFLSWDVLLAAVLVTILAALMLSAYSMQSSRIAFQRSLSERQSDALLLADYLLKHCPEENGLLECDGKIAYSHELHASAIKSFDENRLKQLSAFLGINKNTSLKIFSLDDAVLLDVGSVKGLCIRRLTLLDGMEVVLETCVAE